MMITTASCRARCRPAEHAVEHGRGGDDAAADPECLVLRRDGAEDLQHGLPTAPRSYLDDLTIVEHQGADPIADAKDSPGSDRAGLR
jgi:hypothetical protein